MKPRHGVFESADASRPTAEWTVIASMVLFNAASGNMLVQEIAFSRSSALVLRDAHKHEQSGRAR